MLTVHQRFHEILPHPALAMDLVFDQFVTAQQFEHRVLWFSVIGMELDNQVAANPPRLFSQEQRIVSKNADG
jgi:hypothetical protein